MNGDEALLARATAQLRAARRQLTGVLAERAEPIAITGAGCRFPGGIHSPDALWEFLLREGDAVTEVPPDRWNADEFYSPDPNEPGTMITRWGGFLAGVDQFDPRFFDISPREAAEIDPMHRLLLEVCWEALEDAGEPADQWHGARVGVFIGMGSSDYAQFSLFSGDTARIDAYNTLNTLASMSAGRISHTFGFHGPSLQLDTACSSSLVSLHYAVESLRNRTCEMAIAGGVNLMLLPEITISLAKLKALSPRGRCRAFGEGADGYVRGEGCGLLVLKRLSDAQANGDRVLAVIRGTQVNHDGRSNGISAPNGKAQRMLFEDLLRDTGLSSADIDYIEAHGTGTILGDAIEAESLGTVFGQDRAGAPLYLGSVKTNLGHLETAAGVAGVLKAALALRHGRIPASLHSRQRNPNIDWDRLQLKVPQRLTEWPTQRQPRRATVNSFGISGTNAQVLLESAPEVAESTGEAPPTSHPWPVSRESGHHVLILSARDDTALRQLAIAYEQRLKDAEATQTADICQTAAVGRSRFHHRAAISGRDSAELRAGLDALAAGQATAQVARNTLGARQTTHRIAFLFPGQGAQRIGMGRPLYAEHAGFRAVMDRGDALFQAERGESLLALLDDPAHEARLQRTENAQPALFVLSCALAALWRELGVTPDYLVGHSVGEYAAGVEAGIFSLEEGFRLVAARGRLMQSVATPGGMLAVRAELAPWAERIAERELDVAALNGARSIVVSGDPGALEVLAAELTGQGVQNKRLAVSHAFHSRSMESILPAFAEVVASVDFAPPRLPIVSTVSGRIEAERLATPAYWVDQIRHGVWFHPAMETLRQQDTDVLLELGPGRTLLSLLDPEWPATRLASLHPEETTGATLAHALGALFTQGVDPNWRAFYAGQARQKTALPHYPFQRQRCWTAAAPEGGAAFASARRAKPGADTAQALLGPRVASGREGDWIFETQVSERYPAYLRDHRVNDRAVFPATGHVALAFAAAANALPDQPLELRAVRIHRPLFLSDQPTQLRTRLAPRAAAEWDFQIARRVETEVEWELLCEGVAGVAEPMEGGLSEDDLARLDNPEADQLPAKVYARARRAKLEYGPAFQGIQAARASADGVLARLRLARPLDPANGFVHPALLDAALQTLAAAEVDQAMALRLPVAMERVRFSSWPGAEMLCRSLPGRDTDDGDTARADFQLFDASGAPMGEITGLTLKRARRDSENSAPRPSAPRYRLVTERYGDLGRLRYVPTERAVLGEDEIEVAVSAAALNFRDVLHALGMLPETADRMPFGFEAAGTVSAVGAGVTRFAVGSRVVVGLAVGTMASHCVARERNVYPWPQLLSAPQAAALPLAYLTASYGLEHLGRIQSGDTVLIHSAAGGVGVAAAHLALDAGATVIGTASRPKWDFLRELGVHHCANSRDLEFVEQTRAVVGDQGVDLILNSLNGEFIPASLGLLKPGGRFIEIGKREIWSREQVAAEFPEVEYHPFDLSEVVAADPSLGPRLAEDVLGRVEVGLLAPLPVTEFAADQAERAFRFMAQAKQVGKVVVNFAEPPSVAQPVTEAADERRDFAAPLDRDPGAAKPSGDESVEAVARAALGAVLDIADTASIPFDADLLSLGLDSLLSEELRQVLRQRTGCELDSGFIHDFPTAADLTAHLAAHAPPHAPSSPQAAAPSVAQPAETEPQGAGTEIPIAPRTGGIFPISRAQERIWLSDLLLPGAAAYNEYLGARITGDLRREWVETCLQALVEQEEILRTGFRRHAGEFKQIVFPVGEIRYEEVDLRHLPAGERERHCVEHQNALVGRVFDLAHPPLLVAMGIRLADDKTVLILAFHHIILDGQAAELLLLRLLRGCAALARGESVEPPARRIGYADFAAWDRLPSEARETGLRYWLDQLSGVTTGTELPTDFPRPAKASGRGGAIRAMLDASLTQAIKDYAKRQSVTPYIVMLSAFQAMLYHLTGDRDCTVGTTIADRPARLENVLGMFVGTVAIRVSVDPDEPISRFLQRARRQFADANRHRDVDFQRVIQTLRPERDASRNPLFQVVFDLLRFQDDLREVDGFQVAHYPIDARIAKFDVAFRCLEYDGELQTMVEYATDLFREATIAGLLACYEQCLRHVVDHPDGRVGEMELLPRDQREALLRLGRGETLPLPDPAGVVERFESHAARDPDALALASETQSLTYGELNVRANRLAHRLLAEGITRGARVVVMLPRSLRQCEAVLAVVKSGAAYVSLDPAQPRARLERMLANVQPPVVLTARQAWSEAPTDGGFTWWYLDEPTPSASEAREDNPRIERSLDDPILVFHTSGSTGRPKGVLVPHRGIANLVHWYGHAFQVTPTDRASMLAGIGFDASAFEFWTRLAAGGSLHLPPEHLVLTVEPLIDWLREQRITHAFLPTPIAERVLAKPWSGTCALRFLLLGGDQLHAAPDWATPFTLVNNYGPCEYSVAATSGPVKRETLDAGSIPSIGKPIGNTRLLIASPRQRLLPAGMVGEICLGGPGLAEGYLNEAEQTAAAFVADPYGGEGERLYRTGDRGRWRADGTIEFLGRVDHQVKIRGGRLELGEVETTMRDCDGVAEACVCQQRDASGAVSLRGFVVAPGLSRETLRTYLKQQLPDYMIPGTLTWVAEMPLTPHGKFDRQRLLALPVETENAPSIAETSPEAEALARIFAELLHLPTVDHEASFFDLGGHSLLVAHLIERIREELGHAFTLQEVFNTPSVAELARCIASSDETGKDTVGGDGDLAPLQPHGDKPPLFLVCPASGSPACYRELAVELDPDRPVYGLRAPGLLEDTPPAESVEALAEYFVSMMLKQRARESFTLGGWSFGAVVAWEMARQLEARGARVSLILIDIEVLESALSPLPSQAKPAKFTMMKQGVRNLTRMRAPRNYPELRRIAGWIGASLPSSPRVFLQRDWRASLGYLRALARTSGRSLRLFKHHFQIGAGYHFSPIQADTVFLKTRFDPPSDRDARVVEAFRQLVRGEFSAHPIPGNHMTIFESPHRAKVVDILRARLGPDPRRDWITESPNVKVGAK